MKYLLAAAIALGLVVSSYAIWKASQPLSPEDQARIDAWMAEAKESHKQQSEKLLAEDAARKIVAYSLNPQTRHTAKFAELRSYRLGQSEGLGTWGGPRWNCVGVVEETNVFNASVRHTFAVTLEIRGGKAAPVSFTMDGRQVLP